MTPFRMELFEYCFTELTKSASAILSCVAPHPVCMEDLAGSSRESRHNTRSHWEKCFRSCLGHSSIHCSVIEFHEQSLHTFLTVWSVLTKSV
uniref:Macaca fascicularis brain cDNA, clone: QmoA-10467 n=1 Tax=Macaca fascicularis TaxID=9541 RepID=I7GP64_MACFA|nr:unnamed protein product [Macaca fascicularis]